MSKTVFITGASRGIGRATALLFAREGYRVGAGYHASEVEAKELLAELSRMGAAAQLVRGDVADGGAVRSMADEVECSLGHIDVLVNNAGVSCDALFCDITPDEWERVFDVNAKGAYHATRRVLPGMIRRGEGSIINVSSVWGVYGGSCEAAYSASKAALIGLTKALAREAGPSGVRVNCVAPGVIATDMNARLTDGERAALIDKTPLSRIGTPEDVARAIFFLASPDAAFITGQVLGVDGGFVG
jgi:3-oxoacyl-[acyl-carrier protein] reductase